MPASIAWLTLTAVFVDTIFTLGTIAAGIAEAFVDVVLAVHSSRAIGTVTLITIDEVLARPFVLTRRGAALINFCLTQEACVTRVTHAVKGVVPINACSLTAGRGEAVINIGLTVPARKARWAATTVASNPIDAGSPMLARL